MIADRHLQGSRQEINRISFTPMKTGVNQKANYF